MSEVTNEWLEARIRFLERCKVAESPMHKNDEAMRRPESLYVIADIDALSELLSRRAADDGDLAELRAIEAMIMDFPHPRPLPVPPAKTSDRVRSLLNQLGGQDRDADEGAVTVEGWADLRVFNGAPWNTLRGAANMMRVFMEGIDGDVPVTVTIRRRP